MKKMRTERSGKRQREGGGVKKKRCEPARDKEKEKLSEKSVRISRYNEEFLKKNNIAFVRFSRTAR